MGRAEARIAGRRVVSLMSRKGSEGGVWGEKSWPRPSSSRALPTPSRSVGSLARVELLEAVAAVAFLGSCMLNQNRLVPYCSRYEDATSACPPVVASLGVVVDRALGRCMAQKKCRQ